MPEPLNWHIVLDKLWLWEFHEPGFDILRRGLCADSSSPRTSVIPFGHFTTENDSLRKSPRFSAQFPQTMHRQDTKSWLAKPPRGREEPWGWSPAPTSGFKRDCKNVHTLIAISTNSYYYILIAISKLIAMLWQRSWWYTVYGLIYTEWNYRTNTVMLLYIIINCTRSGRTYYC